MANRKLGVVLVVDDTDAIREAIVSDLRQDGFLVFQAVDGRNALDFLQTLTEPLFALVSDFDMPRMRGDELIHTLESNGIPCSAYILVTGHPENHPPIQDLLTQKIRTPLFVLNKPFKKGALTEILDSLPNKLSSEVVIK